LFEEERMAAITLATFDPTLGVNSDTIDLTAFRTAAVIAHTATGIAFGLTANPGSNILFEGTGLTYDTAGALTGGSITSISVSLSPTFIASQGFAATPALTLIGYLKAGAAQSLRDVMFGGDDKIQGTFQGDIIHGGGGNDTLLGDQGADSLYGGAGNDVIFARQPLTSGGGPEKDTIPEASNYLRGEEGNDSIAGGSGFDDINGNQGNDTVHGGVGNDWVVGGQDNDLLYGDNGNDLVYGNLGNDAVYGGEGDDWVRGGQGDDVVDGGAGNDWLWGDRGSDTMTGGAGADQFHTFAGAGIDRITDFNYAEGDRIVIDDRTGYSVATAGGNTVISLTTGDQLILVGGSGVVASDWIVYA
jgi:Ca2+-binding RTX toxin-like protein